MGLVNFATFLIFFCPLFIQKAHAGLCQDHQLKCSDYASYCSYDHVKKQCPLTCNQCDNVSPTSPIILVTSSHRTTPTPSVTVVYTAGTNNNGAWNEHNTTIRASAPTTDLTQANVLMMLGIIWSYFLSRW
ncbi:uncharacterized protein LOC144633604 [Oculina patagonica]